MEHAGVSSPQYEETFVTMTTLPARSATWNGVPARVLNVVPKIRLSADAMMIKCVVKCESNGIRTKFET